MRFHHHLHRHFVFPFIHHYHHRYHLPWRHHGPTMLVIDLTLASLAAMGLVGGIFAYYLLPAPTPWAGFNLGLIGPAQVRVNEKTNLVVAWSNDTSKAVTCGTLRFILPPEVQVIGQAEGGSKVAAPCLPPNLESINGSVMVALGDLQPSTRGAIRLPVRFYGTSDRPVTVSADFLYWEEGRAQMTRSAVARNWLTNSSVMELAAVWPAKMIIGRETPLTIKYANNGSEALEGVRLRIDAPKGYVVTGASPSRDAAGEFRLAKLEPGEHGLVTLYGRLDRTQAIAPAFTVTAVMVNGETARPLASLHTNADVRSADLQLAVEATSPAGVAGLEPGTQVAYAIHYANAGDQPIEHLSFWLDATALREVVTEPAMAEAKWDEQAYPELVSVAPGASGTVYGNLRVRPDVLDRLDRVTLAVTGRCLLADDAVRPVLVAAAPLEFAVTASASLNARAAYYTPDGDQLGVGPLPPRVGEATQYWLSLKAEAVGKGIKDAVVTAVLPPGVSWTGRTTATAGVAPAFDQSTRRLQWTIGPLTPNQQAVANIEVSLTPTKAEIGRTAILLTNLRLIARDAATEVGLNKHAADLDTELAGDDLAAGKGKIVPAVPQTKAPKPPKSQR